MSWLIHKMGWMKPMVAGLWWVDLSGWEKHVGPWAVLPAPFIGPCFLPHDFTVIWHILFIWDFSNWDPAFDEKQGNSIIWMWLNTHVSSDELPLPLRIWKLFSEAQSYLESWQGTAMVSKSLQLWRSPIRGEKNNPDQKPSLNMPG